MKRIGGAANERPQVGAASGGRPRIHLPCPPVGERGARADVARKGHAVDKRFEIGRVGEVVRIDQRRCEWIGGSETDPARLCGRIRHGTST